MNNIQINCQDAKDLIGVRNVTIIDIRDHDSYKISHIEGAIELNDSNIQKFINESDKNKPILCYCYHGISSLSAVNYLLSQGFKEVYSLQGGFEQWNEFLINKKADDKYENKNL